MTRALLLASLLAAFPARAVEGALSAELTISNQQLGLNATFELSPVLDRLWLYAGYGLLKARDIPPEAGIPRVVTSASHLISAGADLSPHRSWLFSLLAQGSPRATETVVLPPSLLWSTPLTVGASRSSLGASAVAAFDSAGDSAFELGLDAGVGFTWNRLGRLIAWGPSRSFFSDLFVTRPVLGVSALLFDRVTLGLRAGYSFYSANPTEVGRFTVGDLEALPEPVRERVALIQKIADSSSNLAVARRAGFDPSGYPYAPVRFDLKASVQVRFSRVFSAQLAWTYLRYVPGQGFGNVLSLKATFRLGSSWRAWIGASGQLDEPLDYPSTRGPEDPAVSASGYLTVGGEFAF